MHICDHTLKIYINVFVQIKYKQPTLRIMNNFNFLDLFEMYKLIKLNNTV